MNIQGLNKAEVLAALYNNAIVGGLGILHFKNKEMTTEEAEQILDQDPNRYFDYLKGRVMKIKIAGDEIDTRLYNRDNGPGAAERVISELRERV